MKKLIFTAFIAFFFVIAGNAQGIGGKWLASIESPQGAMEMTYTFNVDGNVLTGTITSPMGDMDISNGKVDGNNFTFDMDVMGFVMSNEAKLEDDVIKLKMIMPEGMPEGGEEPGEMILKRIE